MNRFGGAENRPGADLWRGPIGLERMEFLDRVETITRGLNWKQSKFNDVLLHSANYGWKDECLIVYQRREEAARHELPHIFMAAIARWTTYPVTGQRRRVSECGVIGVLPTQPPQI